MKIYYHIRTPNGVTVDWQDGSRSAAIDLARDNHAEVMEIRGSIATRIYSPPTIKSTGG